ncbi:MAG: GTPase Era [Lachnospiraceae bacterium]|nr:GTPase Era [Lachnospiraceae bacterium]
MKRSGFRSGFVTIVGRPNVGKSTLMNHLIGQKIAITSRKPQTTRNAIRTVYTDDEAQLVFVDTPGVQKARNKLGEYMMRSVRGAMADVDVIIWVTAADAPIGEADMTLAKKLQSMDTPVILVVNKIDKVSRAELPERVQAYASLGDFDDVVPVSAKQDTNVSEIIACAKKYLPEGEMFFDADTVTDQPMKQISAEIIREKALRNLGQEIPHGIAVAIERMEYDERGGMYHIDATIICEKDSHKGIIIGKKGSMLKKIGTEARIDIEELTEARVDLQTHVKVKKDWRDSDILLKNYGYDKKEL